MLNFYEFHNLPPSSLVNVFSPYQFLDEMQQTSAYDCGHAESILQEKDVWIDLFAVSSPDEKATKLIASGLITRT